MLLLVWAVHLHDRLDRPLREGRHAMHRGHEPHLSTTVCNRTLTLLARRLHSLCIDFVTLLLAALVASEKNKKETPPPYLLLLFSLPLHRDFPSHQLTPPPLLSLTSSPRSRVLPYIHHGRLSSRQHQEACQGRRVPVPSSARGRCSLRPRSSRRLQPCCPRLPPRCRPQVGWQRQRAQCWCVQ